MSKPLRCVVCEVFKGPSLFPSESHYACSECQANGYDSSGRSPKTRRIAERLEAMAKRAALAEGLPWPPAEEDIDEEPSSCEAELSLVLLRRAASGKVSRRMAQRMRDNAKYLLEELNWRCRWCEKQGVSCSAIAQAREELARRP